MVPSTEPFYSCTFPQQERSQPKIAAENAGREGLVLKYLPLVRMIAWQIYGSLPVHAAVEMGDVLQAGHVGLLDASRSYHPGVDVPFGSYARHRIRGEILDSLRKLDSASRGLRRWQRKLDAETRNLSLTLSREPSEEEVSAQLGINVEHLRKRRLNLWYTSSCIQPANQPGEPEDGSLVPTAAPDGNPDRLHQRVQLRQFLSRAISVLPPRSRKVVILYYLRNLTMKQIGTQLSVNESRISQIHKHALKTMARGLAAAGVKSFRDI